MGGQLSASAARWNRFWFADGPTHGISLLRIFFGLVVLLHVTGLYGLYRIDNLRMRFPRRPVFAVSDLADGFPMPYPGLSWLPVPGPTLLSWLEVAILALTVLMIVGLATRVVVPLLAGTFGYLFLTTQWNFHHHKYLIVLVLAVMAFSRCGDHYSIDAVLRGPGRRTTGSLLPLRLLQTLIVLIYAFTFLSKFGTGWLSGQTIALFAVEGRIRGPFAPFFLDLLGPRLIGIATVAAEGVIALALLMPPVRKIALFTGVLLHLGIDALMDVGTFSYQMLALYVVFVHPAAGATVALYDGRVAGCRRWPRWAAPLDWLRRVSWLDVRDPAVTRQLPQDVVVAADNDLVVVRPDGMVLTGASAWRDVLNSFPLTFVPSVVLYVPPVRWAVDALWAVARRRRSTHGRDVEAVPEPPAWQRTLAKTRVTAQHPRPATAADSPATNLPGS